ncbi:MAG: type II toxin-antitoxin system VapC family toxin [Cyanobacteria bacterium P01_H01_bin.105]
MTYLLDTNVLSAQRRQKHNPTAYNWVKEQEPESLYISLITIGEIRAGIERIQSKDPIQAEALENWLLDTKFFYSDQILGIDEAVIERWGCLGNCQKQHPIDALMAATALEHDFTLVTRNVKHVVDTGVQLLNPWTND